MKTPEPLTARQRQVLDVIARSIREHGYAPSVRELARALDVRSTNGVNDHLCVLVRKGYLRREPGTWRGLALAQEPPPERDPVDAFFAAEEAAKAATRLVTERWAALNAEQRAEAQRRVNAVQP